MRKQKTTFLPYIRFLSCNHEEVTGLFKKGWFPYLFKKNFYALSPDDQVKLINSKVLVIGCGGLGGFVLEMLARLGIGTLIFADGDTFEETNMNRQLFCTLYNLGNNKAYEAKKRLKSVAPLTELYPLSNHLKGQPLESVIKKVDIAVDCTGGVEFKKALLKKCQRLNTPVITSAVAGLEGFITSVTPDSSSPVSFFEGNNQSGAEVFLGTLAPSVGIASSIQVSEVLSFVCYEKLNLQNKILFFSLKELSFEVLTLS